MLAVTLALALVPSAAPAEPPGPPDPAERLRQAVEALDRADQAVADEDFSLFDRLANLIVHGTLHLVGHDHAIDKDAEAMEALEIAALARLGIADPYRGMAA